MLITVVTSTWAKVQVFFISPNFFSEIVRRKPFVIECELRVYRQENGEFERITRIYFVRN